MVETNGAGPAPAKSNRVENPTADLMRRFGEDGQDPAVLGKSLERVRPLLTVDEEISYVAIQRKLSAIVPDSFVLTNKRFIHLSPSLLGQLNVKDIPWRQLLKVDLKEGMLSAMLSIQAEGGYLRLEGIHKNQARKAYGIAREMQDKAHEYRRQVDLETRRASASTVAVGQAPATVVAFDSKPAPDAATELRRLKALADEGLITMDEFSRKKAEILARL